MRGEERILLAVLALHRDGRLMRSVLVPGVSFLMLSAYRNIRNEKRPYEVLDIQPLIPRDRPGKSFPSRHVFSAFVIAMTFLWLKPPLGILFLLTGTGMGLCRVIGGVHWPRDAAAGAAVGIVCGLAGYWWI